MITILETERLILRPWLESDAESLYKYASSPEIGPVTGWPVHKSVDESRQIIKTVLSSPHTYAVIDKNTMLAIGSISIMLGDASNIGIPEDEAEIGYWVGVPYWGRGLIPEAAREIIKYAFKELGVKRVWCSYFDGNTKSKRVQEKCGFHYKYTVDNFFVKPLGEERILHITCLTKEEWQNSNQEE